MPFVERSAGVIVAAFARKQPGVAEEFVTPLTYDIAADMPGGAVNTITLEKEIRASAIVTKLFSARANGNVLSILFDTLPLPAGDKTILDGDITGPAGGLLAAHDNEVSNLPIAHTEDATLQVGDLRYHTNKAASAEVILTLPSPKGESPSDPFIFEVVAAQNFRIKAAAAHTLRVNNDVSIAGGYIESAVTGGLVSFNPSGANGWIASSVVGTWDLETS